MMHSIHPDFPVALDQPTRRRGATTVAALALSALLSVHIAARAEPDVQLPASRAEAMTFYERCQWAPAFEQLSRLADAGDAEAARIALLMKREGPILYATPFDASAQQIERWLVLASARAQSALALRLGV